MLAVLLLIGSGRVSAQDGEVPSPELQLTPQSDSLLFRLTGLPADGRGVWVLQSSIDLSDWEDLAIFDKPAAPGADVELELGIGSTPNPGAAQQFFRACALEAEGPYLRDYLAARDTWRRSGVDDYTIETRWFVSQFVWHGTVKVRDHAVDSSEVIFTNFFDPPEPKTIDDWFDQLKSFIDQEADEIIVTYDAVFGYPISVSVDVSFQIADEEQSWSILSFNPQR